MIVFVLVNFLFIPDSFFIRSFDSRSKEHLATRELVPFPLQIQLQTKYFSPCLKFSSFYHPQKKKLTCCAVLRFLQLLVLRWIILWFLLLPPQKRRSLGSPSWRKCVHHSRPQLPPLKWTKSDHVLKSFKLLRFTDFESCNEKDPKKRQRHRPERKAATILFCLFSLLHPILEDSKTLCSQVWFFLFASWSFSPTGCICWRGSGTHHVVRRVIHVLRWAVCNCESLPLSAYMTEAQINLWSGAFKKTAPNSQGNKTFLNHKSRFWATCVCRTKQAHRRDLRISRISYCMSFHQLITK